MRHAGAWAVERLLSAAPPSVEGMWMRACGDWILDPDEDCISRGEVDDMLELGKEIDLPTCPKCAVVWDHALELRRSSQEAP
jgi:hypothetical protein